MRTKEETLRLLQEGFIRDADGTVYWEHDDLGSIGSSPHLLEEGLGSLGIPVGLVNTLDDVLEAAAIWEVQVTDSPDRLTEDGYVADERRAYWIADYEEALERLMDDEKCPELTKSDLRERVRDLREIAAKTEREPVTKGKETMSGPEIGEPELD